MNQVESLQQEISQQREELHQLCQQLGYAKSSMEGLIELVKNAYQDKQPSVVTAKLFLNDPSKALSS